MTHTAPGIHKFREFVAQQAVQTPCPCCFETHIIPDDDDKASLQPPDPIQTQTQEIQPQFPLQQIGPPTTTQEQKKNSLTTTTQVDFTPLQHPDQPNLIEQEEEPTKLNPSDELLRWHYKVGHAPIQTVATHGLPRRFTKTIGNSDLSFLCSLQIWQTNQMATAHQRSSRTHMTDHSTRSSGFGRSTRVNHARLRGTTQGTLNNTTLQLCNILCGSILQVIVCFVAEKDNKCRDCLSKTILRTLCMGSWSQDPPLSCQQRQICRYRLYPSLQRQQSRHNLLQSQCSFSKWRRRKENSGPTRTGQNNASLCGAQVASNALYGTMTIHSTNSQRGAQRNTN